jgi:hypothetical protein
MQLQLCYNVVVAQTGVLLVILDDVVTEVNPNYDEKSGLEQTVERVWPPHDKSGSTNGGDPTDSYR